MAKRNKGKDAVAAGRGHEDPCRSHMEMARALLEGVAEQKVRKAQYAATRFYGNFSQPAWVLVGRLDDLHGPQSDGAIAGEEGFSTNIMMSYLWRLASGSPRAAPPRSLKELVTRIFSEETWNLLLEELKILIDAVKLPNGEYRSAYNAYWDAYVKQREERRRTRAAKDDRETKVEIAQTEAWYPFALEGRAAGGFGVPLRGAVKSAIERAKRELADLENAKEKPGAELDMSELMGTKPELEIMAAFGAEYDLFVTVWPTHEVRNEQYVMEGMHGMFVDARERSEAIRRSQRERARAEALEEMVCNAAHDVRRVIRGIDIRAGKEALEEIRHYYMFQIVGRYTAELISDGARGWGYPRGFDKGETLHDWLGNTIRIAARIYVVEVRARDSVNSLANVTICDEAEKLFERFTFRGGDPHLAAIEPAHRQGYCGAIISILRDVLAYSPEGSRIEVDLKTDGTVRIVNECRERTDRVGRTKAAASSFVRLYLSDDETRDRVKMGYAEERGNLVYVTEIPAPDGFVEG